MKAWEITAIAAVVLIALGSVLISAYGNARYDAGVSSCTAAQAGTEIQNINSEIKGRDKIDAKVINTEISDIDNDGAARGWVRG